MRRVFQAIGGYIRTTDKFLWGYCLFASSLSLLLLFSIYYNGFIDRPRLVLVQVLATALGVAVAVVISLVDYHSIASLWKIHMPAAIVLTLLTFTPLGVQREGTDDRAWLNLGITTLQPSELLKLSFIFTFALHLSRVKDHINDVKTFLLLCLHGAIPIGLIVLQGDYGSALVFVFIFVLMMFVAGLSWKLIAIGLAGSGVVAVLSWFFLLEEHHRNRFKIMFNPELDPMGAGFQQMQGRIALGSGQLFGRGLFSHNLLNIPEVYNDFIFAYIGQTLGFVGCIAVCVLLGLICFKVLMVARMSRDELGCYICVGVFATIFFQALVNIGMVLSVMPVIGITLPFLSSGGTSVVMMYISVGMVLSVYMRNVRRVTY